MCVIILPIFCLFHLTYLLTIYSIILPIPAVQISVDTSPVPAAESLQSHLEVKSTRSKAFFPKLLT